jgi:uncharacterized protein
MVKQYREQAIRIDRIDIDSYGILRAKARIARIGVQEYWRDGEVVRELRLPEEVEKSANSFSQAIVTLDHPDVFIVDSANAQQYCKGLTGEVNYEDGWLIAPITVTHQDAVTAAQTTHKQFSNGYFCILEESAGEWVDDLGVMGTPGQSYSYDCIQRDIEGNHVALVTRARAGNKATYTDEADFIINYNSDTKENMVKIVHSDRVLEIEGNDAQTVADIVSEYKTKLDEATGKADEADLLRALASQLEGKIAGLEAAKTDEVDISKEIESRVALWRTIGNHLDVDPDYSLSETEIKKFYLSQALPDLKGKIASADEAYINGIWEIKQPTTNGSLTRAIADALKTPQNTPKNDADNYESARKAYLDYRRNHTK